MSSSGFSFPSCQKLISTLTKAKKLCVKRLRRQPPKSCPIAYHLSLLDELAAVASVDNNSSASTTTVSSSSSSASSWHAEDHNIDARAERFIGMFKEELRLQEPKAIEEYHAMLTRGL